MLRAYPPEPYFVTSAAMRSYEKSRSPGSCATSSDLAPKSSTPAHLDMLAAALVGYRYHRFCSLRVAGIKRTRYGGTRTWSSGRVGWHAPQLVEGGIGSIGCLPAGTDPVEWAVHRLIAWCIAPLRGSIDEIEDCPRPAREACRSGDMVTAAAEIELRGCADRFGMRNRNAPTRSRSATSQLDACQRHVRHGGRNSVTVGAARQPKPIKTARASLGSDLQ